MKSPIKDLASQLSGEVTIAESARRYFSTDGSIFTVKPKMVIYPRNETDVVNVVKYLNWKAQEGEVINLTARGKGTDQGGGALGNGAMLVFPAHMKALKHIDKETITVQPGMIYAHLQGILHSHWRFLPPYPASIDFCTIGGAVANNAAGEKTLKYGSTRHWVKALRVVLSNGDVITTSRLNKKELRAKKAQSDFEGHLYREIDAMIEANQKLLHDHNLHVSKNSAGYDLWDVKRSDGSLDLSQLIVGSQGTLGVVSEATFYTEAYSSKTTLVVGYFESIHKAQEAVQHLMKLQPSALEVVDHHLLEFLQKNKPEQLAGLLPSEEIPRIVLLCEFDDSKPKAQAKKAKAASAIFKHYAHDQRLAVNKDQEDQLWRIRRGAAAVIWTVDGPKKALPIIEDGAVPVEKLGELLEEADKMFAKYKVEVAIWGHAGNGHLHIQPFLDLANLRDRAKLFALTNAFYKLVIKLGGTTCGEHNDGIMRAPYLKALYGADLYKLFEDVKNLFDPNNFLNNQVKIGVSHEDAVTKLRREYNMRHLHDHLPASYNH
ncbi:FAD-binding oxidoreductase [Candidatus Saccharibacteria bacterium]|nr:FAD-binding oxidoreductase [Candidatus Saccharibacteria bacterium]